MFQENDRVLARHADGLFEAKIISITETSDGPRYSIHYQGWAKTWDETVKESRLQEFDEEILRQNREEQEEKEKEREKEREKEKEADPPAVQLEAPKKRRRFVHDDDDADHVEHLSAYVAKSEVRFALPDSLKRRLVSDWEAVAIQKKLVPLPHNTTVATLLSEFLDSERRRTGSIETAKTVIDGLLKYFDIALGTILLMRFERPQLVSLLRSSPGSPPSELYGAEHLLRLLGRMPQLLAHTSLSPQQLEVILSTLNALVLYLQSHGDLFTQMYDNAAPQYIREAL